MTIIFINDDKLDPIPEITVEYLSCSHTEMRRNKQFICVFRNIHTSYFGFRPDGQKKAYVRLAPDYDALDVANKIGII